MSVNTSTVQPSVWLACLDCYNEDRLVGAWLPCDGIEEVTLAEVHGGAEHVRPGCEEVLALDTEHLPVGLGEVTQAEAAAWGELFVEVGESQWPALLAWFEQCSPSLDVDGVPSVVEFEEANQGHWDSFDEFVRSWADDCGMFHGWPEEAVTYFDWDAYERDQRHDFAVVDAPDGGVHVFRDC